MNTYYGVSAWQWQSNSDYLAHHGILGQCWGKRNGPPYPLSAGAHSSAEKRLKSKNDGKLESWKAKELKKIDKKYDKKIRKIDKKWKSLDNSTPADYAPEELVQEYVNKMLRLRDRKRALSNAKQKEISVVMQMSLEDAKAEKAYIGKKNSY